MALAPSGGSGDSQACCAAITRSAGTRASAPPPAPLAEQQAQRRRLERHQLGDAAGDLAGQSALFGLPGQGNPGGIDHGDEGQPQLGGEAHAASGFTHRRRAQGLLGVCPRRSCPSSTHRAPRIGPAR